MIDYFNTPLHVREKGNMILEVFPDQFPQNPREWSNYSVIARVMDRDYDFGDISLSQDFSVYYNEDMYDLRSIQEKSLLTLCWSYNDYGSGGIRFNVEDNPYKRKWLDGNECAGVIYASKENAIECNGNTRINKKKLKKYLKQEMNDYENYVNRQTLVAVLSEKEKCNLGHEHKNCIESMGNFYEIEDALEYFSDCKNYRITKEI